VERFKRSWQLVKSSWGVLRSDKELMLFPVISGIVMFIALGVLFLVWAGVFFNAALIAADNVRLEGGDPTLADGFHVALSHLPAILGWAAIAATVGLVLSALRERGGAIVSLLGNMAWAIVTFLVVLVLVIEGVGPIEAIKHSAGLLRKTWGEQIVGNFSIGLVTGLALLAALVVGGLIVFVLFGISEVLGMLGAVILVAGLIILGLIGSTLSGIFNIALYRYASGRDADAFFPRATLAGAFRDRWRPRRPQVYLAGG
jgi:hypothetical protein